jgi:hypothetical protein
MYWVLSYISCIEIDSKLNCYYKVAAMMNDHVLGQKKLNTSELSKSFCSIIMFDDMLRKGWKILLG